jgi:hypothetical protein
MGGGSFEPEIGEAILTGYLAQARLFLTGGRLRVPVRFDTIAGVRARGALLHRLPGGKCVLQSEAPGA